MEKPTFKKEVPPGIPNWLKVAILCLAILAANPVFSQEQGEEGNEKDKIELITKIQRGYQNYISIKEQKLNHFDEQFFTPNIKKMSPEEKEQEKNRLESEISEYKKITENPEKYYEHLWQETEKVKSELREHILSNEFLEKLKLKMSHEDALARQQRLIENLENVQIKFEDFGYIWREHGGAGVFLPEENLILIPFNYDITFPKFLVAHELLHAIYGTDREISPEEKEVLIANFKKDPKLTKDENAYQKSPAERIARKVYLDIEMKDLGIKNYKEKFTSEHYRMLKELQKKGKLSESTIQILNTITEKQLIEIMNTIAFNDATETHLDENQV